MITISARKEVTLDSIVKDDATVRTQVRLDALFNTFEINKYDVKKWELCRLVTSHGDEEFRGTAILADNQVVAFTGEWNDLLAGYKSHEGVCEIGIPEPVTLSLIDEAYRVKYIASPVNSYHNMDGWPILLGKPKGLNDEEELDAVSKKAKAEINRRVKAKYMVGK